MKASDKKDGGRQGTVPPQGGKSSASAKADKPEWAQSLRQLYDSVVDEPLPDSFKNLLEKLDTPK